MASSVAWRSRRIREDAGFVSEDVEEICAAAVAAARVRANTAKYQRARIVPTRLEVFSECKTPWVKSQIPNPKLQIPSVANGHETLGLRIRDLGLGISQIDPSSSRARIAVRTRSINRSRSS